MELKKSYSRLISGDTIFHVDLRFAFIDMTFEGDSWKSFLYGCPDKVSIVKNGKDNRLIFDICGDGYMCDSEIRSIAWVDDGKMEITFADGEKISLKYETHSKIIA